MDKWTSADVAKSYRQACQACDLRAMRSIESKYPDFEVELAAIRRAWYEPKKEG